MAGPHLSSRIQALLLLEIKIKIKGLGMNNTGGIAGLLSRWCSHFGFGPLAKILGILGRDMGAYFFLKGSHKSCNIIKTLLLSQKVGHEIEVLDPL